MKAIRSLCFTAALLLLLPTAARAGDSCQSDEDCPDGHECIVVCAPSPAECMVDDDCPDGTYCVDGCCTDGEEPCIPPAHACDSDADCPPGAFCHEGCCSEDGEGCIPHTGEDCYGYCEPRGGEFGECEVDADCPEGWYCLALEFETCWTDPDGTTTCESEYESACVPDWFVECEADDDCGEGLECHSFQEEFCESVPCPPGEDCGYECQSVDFALCLPPYVLECEEDADCGEGFTCEFYETCVCEEETGPDLPPPPEGESEPNCECFVSDVGTCRLVAQICEEETDCPDGWTCEESHSLTEPCVVDDEGNVDCPEDGEEAFSYCVPPYWLDFEGGGSDGEPSVPGEDDQTDDGGSEGGTEEPPEGVDESDEDDSDQESQGEDDGSRSSGGCSSTGGGGAHGGLLALLMLGLFARARPGAGS